MKSFDLSQVSVRALNQYLHDQRGSEVVEVLEPRGAHAVACGLLAPLHINIHGPVGYYCAGMNEKATVTVHGNAGTGVAENMMSGEVRVMGNASQSAGATAHGGMLVIQGDASARCGISLKGGTIVVGGSVGHMSAFMAQAGTMVICGDAGEALGDSIYEARIYLRGKAASLGADCVEKEMRADHLAELTKLLAIAKIDADPATFRRYGSGRTLYHFHTDHAAAY
jgi:glutamate synthase domain-containing protein 3